MGEPVPYVAGGVEVAPGPKKQVKLPARVFRGRLTGLLFETNKTFLLPGSLKGIRGLRSFYDQHKGMQVLVVGHTDTVGPPASNLTLSIERAKSIAAYLTDDADFWMEFYAGRTGSSVWGVREDQFMLSELTDGMVPLYSGPIDGQTGPGTRDALKKFQQLSNERRGTSLNVDGNPGQKTRKEMVLAYMQLPGTTLPDGTILKTHGCGEFHLAKETPDGTDEQENRRVEVFFFEGMIDPAPRDRCPSPGCPEEPVWVQKAMHTFDLSHDPGALTIKVVDQKGGPVGEAQVHLAGPTLGDDKSDGGGLVAFKDLIPGHYTVLARKVGLQNGTADVEVGPGQPPGKEPGPGSSTAVTLQAGDGGLGLSVIDEDKNAVPNATVLLLDKVGKQVKKDITGPSGTLKFDGVPAGDYTLEINAPGFDFKTAPATVAPDIDTPISVPLDHETGSVEVTVKDDAGNLLDGAQVKVTPASGAAPTPGKTVKGVVKFSKVRTGPCTIDATLDLFNPGKGSATVASGAKATATVTLKAATAALTVHVVSTGPGKRILPGAKVTISGPTGTTESTGTDGNFTFSELPIGTYDVSAALDGFDPSPVQSVKIGAGKSNALTIKLTPNEGKLVVSVLDGLGKAVDDAEVRVAQPPPFAELGPETTKDKKPVEFGKVRAGNCQVTVKKSGFTDGKGTVTVVGDSSVSLKVVLSADQMPFVVTVKNSDGALLEGAAVTIDGAAGTTGATNKEGRFDVKALAVGDYKVSASLDNHTAPAPVKVTISPTADNALTIELKPDAITAEITPNPLLVVVKKNVCTPARKPVTLQTKGPAFKGKGKLSVSKPHLKIFDLDKGGKEITSADELDGAALTAGLKLFAEGVSASDAANDTELTLELFVGKNKFGKKATGKATAVELTLDLFNAPATAAAGTPTVQDEKTRTTVGRFVHKQGGVPLHHHRALAVVRETKPDVKATLELKVVKSGTGDVKLFDADAPGGAAVAAPFPVAPGDFKKKVGATNGVSVFVEGSTTSTGPRDLFLQLGLKGDEADGDRALVTVFEITRIDLSVPNTKCKRTGVATAPAVKTSIVDDPAFLATDPVVLQGCGEIDFTAAVTPGATPLSWIAVQATDDAGPKKAPKVTENAADAKKMKLTCDAEGSFHINAFVDQKGDTKKRAPAESGMIFNLHMVNVEVQTAAADTKTVVTELRTGAVAGTRLRVQTGVSPFPAMGYGDAELTRHAFGMKTTVKLRGGGADRMRGVVDGAVVKLGMGYIQDLMADSVVGTYADGRTEKEVVTTLPLPAGVVVGGAVTAAKPPALALPVRDHKDPGQSGRSTFINGSDDSDRDADNVTWRVRMIDSPAISVHMRHPATASALNALAGNNSFKVWCCAFPVDFPENYVVVSEATWIADYGSFTAPATWNKTGAISAAGLAHHKPPIRAEDANLEHCPPAFTETFVMDASS